MKRSICFFSVAVFCLVTLFASGGKEIKGDNTLRVMKSDGIDSLDPQMSVFTGSFEIIADFTDGLKQIAPDGTTVNALCSDEQVSSDGLTYTYTIRPDAFWSNGDPVTAADFVFAWRRVVDPNSGSRSPYLFTDIAHIKNATEVLQKELPLSSLGVTALDSKTLQVQLSLPVPYFDDLLTLPSFYPVNEAFFHRCGNLFATSAETLLSNGAFMVSDYTPLASHISLIKNPTYYDEQRIALSGLEYQEILDSGQALMNFQNGDLDVITLSGDQIEMVEDDPAYQSAKSGTFWYLSLNIAGSKEIGNLDLRRALTYAINRKALVEDVTADGSTPLYSAVPSSLAFDSNGVDFTPNGAAPTPWCDLNEEKAQFYFAKAQEALGEETIALTLLVDSALVQQNVAMVLKSELETAFPSLSVTIKVEPKKQRVQDMFDGNYDLVLTRWTPSYPDPTATLNLFIDGSLYNTGKWHNDTFNTIIDQCMSGSLVSNPTERWEALHQAEDVLMENCVMIPLYEQSHAMLINQRVSGLAFHSLGIARVYKDVVLHSAHIYP